MRITIIPIDGVVIIDGIITSEVDLSFIDPTIHAVQWYGNAGTIEYKNVDTMQLTHIEDITDISQFQPAIDAAVLKKKLDAAKSVATANEMMLNKAYDARATLLYLSDWTQGLDSPLSDVQKNAWREYRQQLRDITLQPGFPTDINWPVAPD